MATAAMALSRKKRLPRGWLRWLLLALACLAAAILLAHYAVRPSGPAVNALVIHVPANKVLTAGQVRSAVAGVVHGGVFDVDLATVRAAVQKLPWVASARVSRIWPDALGVSVQLRRPVARWGKDALVDANGVVFAPSNLSAFSALPMLDGPADQAADVLNDFSRVQAEVRQVGLRATGLDDNARGEMSVTFESGLQLVLGRKAPFERLERFIHIAVPALGPKLARAATVDMRYPNGFAVGWKGEGDHGRKE
jgi:cell division protein FtsQ